MAELEYVLPEIMKSLKSTYGDEFFHEITLQLNKIIDADYTFIARVDMTQQTAKTISMVEKAEFVDNIEYGLNHTPCASVLDTSVCIYPQNICNLFPKDQMLKDMNIEGYVGVALHNSHHEIIGIIVALHKTKIKDPQLINTLFELFSGRIAAEMERAEQEHNLEKLNDELESKVNALVESEAKLSIHLQNTPLGCLSWDTNFYCTEWNKSAEQMFGYTAEEAIGRHACELIVPAEIKDVVNGIYKSLLEQKGGTRSTNENITKDGHIIICDWHNTPIIDKNNTVTGIASLIQDITARKRAETELQTSNVLLDESQKLAKVGGWELDLKTGNLFWTAETYALHDTSPEEFNPTVDAGVGYFLPKSREIITQANDAAINECKDYDLELKTYTTKGRKIDVRTTCSVFQENGKAVKLRGIFQDITQQKQDERTLRHSTKMDAIGQMAGGVAHDFNNILGIVSGNLELLQRMLPTDSKEYQRVINALKGTTRGTSITRKLLNFSRKDAEDVQPTNINDFITHNLDLIKKSLTPSILIETNLEKMLWITEIDQGDFEDTLLNISLNAHDVMPDGGTLTITTSNQVLHDLEPDNTLLSNSAENKSDFVLISITDTGSGMSEEVREKVLEPFFTTKDKSKGTGLGLSMVHGFVKRSGGHIEINSIIDEGSTFKLFLPRLKEKIRLNSTESIDVECPKGNETILIVDDEEALREIAQHLLTELGYTVLTAANGDEALEKLETGIKIDLLFSDVVMPGKLDGYKLAIAVNKLQPDLKILLTSGYTYKRDEILTENNEYLSKLLAKPYSEVELSLAIHNTLNAD